MPRLTREDVLAKLDIASFYELQFQSLGIRLGRQGTELAARCPFPPHEDSSPSFTINPSTGVFYCHACKATGSPFDFVMRRENVDFPTAFDRVRQFAGLQDGGDENRPEIPEDLVASKHQQLIGAQQRMDWLHEARGLSKETIRRFEIGWDGSRYWIPVRDEHRRLVNVRKYQPDAKNPKYKIINHTIGKGDEKTGYGKMRLYPLPVPPEFVVIAEGEWDTMLAIQHGFPAITSTAGAGHFSPTWRPLFMGKHVVIAGDNDEAGREGALSIAAQLCDVAASVRILRWPPIVENREDITDWFVKNGQGAAEFQALIDAAEPYVKQQQELQQAEPEAESVALSQAAEAKYNGRPVRMRFMVSGKDTEPFIVPRKVKITCDQENGTACLTCGMQLKHKGKGELEFADKDRETLGLINCSEAQQKGFIARKFGIVARCSRYRTHVEESQNIQDITVIPEMNGNLLHSEEGEYVTRTMYAMTSDVHTNKVYEATGYTHPDVTQQRATCLLGHVDPVEMSIDHFDLTPQQIASLRIFNPDKANRKVWDKMFWRAREMEKVHHIRDRLTTQIAYDLCWHSALAFDCYGETQDKGWLDVVMIGASGQGKSKIAEVMMQFYQTGQRINGEHASVAGLIGGIEKKSNGRFGVQWGAMVLNSGRLLHIDEAHGLKEDVLEAMTDIRSTGRAQIIKIHREEAPARTRLLMVMNPPSGRTMDSFDHGVEALYPGVFRKPEDVRRIDIAIAVNTNEVSADVLNQTYHDVETPAFTSEDCYNLVMWCWSRKRKNIQIDRDAETVMIEHAKFLSSKYSSKIPLVEGADVRHKLARVAVAVAGCQFSTDDGVNLKVNFEHADFAGKFIDHCFSSPALAYDRYSSRHLRAERFVAEHEIEIIDGLKKSCQNPGELTEYLINERYLVQKDMEAQTGLTREEVKKLIYLLTRMKCLERMNGSFRKKPAFTVLLRKMEKEHLPKWKAERDPLGLETDNEDPVHAAQ